MTAASGGIPHLLDTASVLVCAGAGGVGKTTTSAAIALAAAERSRRVVVVTIDPAKRLADSIGVTLSHEPSRVPNVTGGELWAVMLDTRSTFDDLVRRYSASPEQAELILGNRFYRNLAGSLSGTQEYMAAEKLYELHNDERFDLVVVDTPPTRHALDFLDAPARLADFFSSRLLRWLIAPKASTLVGMASKPFTQVADRILGTQFLADITDFFMSLQSMYDGFVERSNAVTRLLSDERTTFMVVSSSETVPLREAEFFATELHRRDLDVGAVILNRILPASLSDDAAAKAAHRIAGRSADEVATLARTLGLEAGVVDRVLDTTVASFEDYAVVARREAGAREQFPLGRASLVTVPQLEHDVADMSGLLEIGRRLLDS
jgi:TRC40/GET3/ArsA family transport-energizing ATPase